MRTSGEFTTHKFYVPIKFGDTIEVCAVGDIHRTSPMCALESWKDWLNEQKKKSKCYYLLMGDYIDLMSTSERFAINSHEFHESTVETWENQYKEAVKLLADELLSVIPKDRFIGVINGNHYVDFKAGFNSDHLLADMLGTKYLGCSSFIRLVLKNSSRHELRFDVWANHGQGGGRFVGSSLNYLERNILTCDADIIFQGHDHKRALATKSRLYLHEGEGRLEVREKRIILARTGSFLKGYEENKKSYITDLNVSPTDLGSISVYIKTHRKVRKENGKTKEKKYAELGAGF